jgi:hypothetical protein
MLAIMQETNCPLCYGELEVRDVAPCDECGAVPQEIEHFAYGKHTYAEYEVFPPLKVTLCNFCDVDFGSYDPTFFGLPPKARIGYQYMRLIEPVRQPTLSKDKYCPTCNLRLSFLRFVHRSRQQHAR